MRSIIIQVKLLKLIKSYGIIIFLNDRSCSNTFFIIFNCMINFKAWVEAQGCVAELAPVPSLMTMSHFSCTAHFAICPLSHRYGLGKCSLCETKR